ncbi:MAG: TSUP family transporter [Treponema sp.]|nr:TSUP family transporter [Treponema sp.]
MLIQFLIVCPLVFVAGFVDAVAGGGGLITLPAYIIAGFPVHNAIATNKMSSSMGSTAATIKYALNGFINWKMAPFCAAFSLAGSAIGSNISLLISDSIFKIIMLVLLPLIACYVLKTKKIESSREPFSFTKTLIICVVIAFFIGMYDGFYGPGTGTFLMLLLTGIARISLNEAAGTTKIVNLSSNYAALAVFLFNGKVLLPIGITAGIFSMAGNYLGASAFTKKGVKFVKPIIILILVLFFVKIIMELIK